MTDPLRTRIAAVQREHRLTSFGANYVQCECGWKSPEKYATWTDHPEHVADAVIRELNLQPETMYSPSGAILTRLDGKVLADSRYMTRWATPWVADESPVK